MPLSAASARYRRAREHRDGPPRVIDEPPHAEASDERRSGMIPDHQRRYVYRRNIVPRYAERRTRYLGARLPLRLDNRQFAGQK